MHKLKSNLVAILLAASGTIHGQTKEPMKNETMSTDQKAAMATILKMTSAFHDKDLSRVLASYEKAPVIVFEPGKPVADPKEIERSFHGFFALSPTFEYGGHEVYVAGDLAIHFAPWTMTGKAPDGSTISESGLSVAVLRKQTDGRWLMVFDNPFGQRLLEEVNN